MNQTIREIIRRHGVHPASARNVKLNNKRVEDFGRAVNPGDVVTWTADGCGFEAEVAFPAAGAAAEASAK